jgi:hypothetical protein
MKVDLEEIESSLAAKKAAADNNERQRLMQLERNAEARLKASNITPTPDKIEAMVRQMEQEEMQRKMNEAAARQEREPLLVGGQKKLDANKDGEISGADFAMLRDKKAEGSLLIAREKYGIGGAFLKASKEAIKALKELSKDNAQGAGVTFSKTELIKEYKTPEAFLDSYGDLSSFKKRQDGFANELIDSGLDPKSVKRILTKDAKDLTEGERSVQEKFLKKYFPKTESGRLIPETKRPILIEFKEGREPKAEGSMMMPPEGMPVDTYDNIPADEIDEVLASQLPDDEMEEDYIKYVMDESLNDEEQMYLAGALQDDDRLSDILDKVIATASEFSGAGEVDGPGTGVSDSIPARLSDGEFVFTKKATDQIGAENLQRMMDDAERAYDGGVMMAEGGMMDEEDPGMSKTKEEIEKLMMGANRMPSLR